MKLNLLFLALDLLTLLAFPVVFVHGIVFRYFKSIKTAVRSIH